MQAWELWLRRQECSDPQCCGYKRATAIVTAPTLVAALEDWSADEKSKGWEVVGIKPVVETLVYNHDD